MGKRGRAAASGGTGGGTGGNSREGQAAVSAAGAVEAGARILATPGQVFGTQKTAAAGGPGRPQMAKRLHKVLASAADEDGSAGSYLQLAAPPSMYPPKRYCDLTGMPAKYTEPTTKIRYANKASYSAIKAMPLELADAWLALRGDSAGKIR